MTVKLSLSDDQTKEILSCLRNKLAEIRKALGQSETSINSVLGFAVLSKYDDNMPEFNLLKQFIETKKLCDYINTKYLG